MLLRLDYRLNVMFFLYRFLSFCSRLQASTSIKNVSGASTDLFDPAAVSNDEQEIQPVRNTRSRLKGTSINTFASFLHALLAKSQ